MQYPGMIEDPELYDENGLRICACCKKDAAKKSCCSKEKAEKK